MPVYPPAAALAVAKEMTAVLNSLFPWPILCNTRSVKEDDEKTDVDQE